MALKAEESHQKFASTNLQGKAGQAHFTFNTGTVFQDPQGLSSGNPARPARFTIKPKEYSGGPNSDPQEYIDVFKLISKSNSWTNKQMCDIFATQLKGVAWGWYMQNTAQRQRDGYGDWNWQELGKAFLSSAGNG